MALAYWDDPPSRAHFVHSRGRQTKQLRRNSFQAMGTRWAPSRVLNVVMGAENKWVTGVLPPLLITGDGAQLSAGLDVSLFGGIGHFKIH